MKLSRKINGRLAVPIHHPGQRPDDLMKQDEENWGLLHAGMFQNFLGKTFPNSSEIWFIYVHLAGLMSLRRFSGCFFWNTCISYLYININIYIRYTHICSPWNFSKSMQFLYHLLAQRWLVEALSPFELLAFADAAENHSTGGRRGTALVQLQWFQWKSSSTSHP